MEHPSLTSEMPVASPLLTTTGAFRRVEKLEAAVTRREEILSAVAFAATRFLDESDWETNIRDVLDRLGSAAEVSRVYLFELFTDAGGVLRTSQRYEWVAPGVTAEIDNPQLQNMDLVAVGLSRWAELLPSGEAIYGIAHDFPPSERELLDSQDIVSIAVVPVVAGTECWGFLGFDECFTRREWGTELDALRAAAGMLGAALSRRRSDRRTAAQYAIARMLIESQEVTGLPPGIVETICRYLECRGGRIWRNDEAPVSLQCRACWIDSHQSPINLAVNEPPPPLVSRSFATKDIIVARPEAQPGEHAPLLAIFPLKTGATVFGVVELVDPAGSPNDEGLRQTLAVIGGAIGQFLERQLAAERALVEESERRRGEQELGESEERFRRLLEASNEGIVIHENGVVLDMSPRFAEMVGYTSEELLGRNILEFIAAPGWRDVIIERVRSGSEQPYEMMGLRKDGTQIAVEIQARATTFHGRQVRVAAVRDITERKLLEQQAMQLMQEQAARTAAETAGKRAEFLAEASRVLGTSFDYQVTLGMLAHLAVPRLADFCTVDMAEGDGVFLRLGMAHTDPKKEGLLRALDHFAADDLSDRHPLIHVLTTGTSAMMADISEGELDRLGMPAERLANLRRLGPKSMISVPLMSSGQVLGAVTFVMAESGRRYEADDLAMAEELARRAALAVDNARLFKEAQAATRARDEMLGVVAHDLRNPLNTIIMASDLVMELPADTLIAKSRKTVEMIRRAADRMNRLIQDLLDIKRIEGGRLPVEPRPESLSAVVNEAVEMLRPLANGAALRLMTDMPDDLPRALIDPPRIHQVLSNLVGNSIKFTPPGGSITVKAEPLADCSLRISVIDTGPGIAPEQISHLFGRYWQGNRNDRRGIGLGLAISKGIVEAHNGRIWVESTPGEGSRFHFTVPSPNDTNTSSGQQSYVA